MWVDSSVWSNKVVRFPHATVVRGLSSCLLPTWGLPKPPISQQNSPNKLRKKHKKVIVSCQVGELNGFIMSYKESQSWLVGEARGPAVSRSKTVIGGFREHHIKAHMYSKYWPLSVFLGRNTHLCRHICTHTPTPVSFLFGSQAIFKPLQFFPCWKDAM